jgi:Leucine-rich repeat (LRR) protein
MPTRIRISLLALLSLSLTACGNMDIAVNDRNVHTPQPVFSDFEVSDDALRQCLTRAISHGGIRAASALTDLNCSRTGISAIDGLATFNGLLKLRLSSNSVDTVAGIESLTTLQELYLDNNAVTDPSPLYKLADLRFLDLSGNPELECPDSEALARVQTVVLPRHCR